MKLEDAINELSEIREALSYGRMVKKAMACQIGCEAINRLQENRRDPSQSHWILLNNETQEPLTLGKHGK